MVGMNFDKSLSLRENAGSKIRRPKIAKTENKRLSSRTDLARRESHFHGLSRAEGPKGQMLKGERLRQPRLIPQGGMG